VAYAGTAGAMLLFLEGREGESSLSRRVFSEERMRREVMMMGEAEGGESGSGRLGGGGGRWAVEVEVEGILMFSELGMCHVQRPYVQCVSRSIS
jgi:hypothetical protein